VREGERGARAKRWSLIGKEGTGSERAIMATCNSTTRLGKGLMARPAYKHSARYKR